MKNYAISHPFRFSAQQVYILLFLLIIAVASNSVAAFLWLDYLVETFGGK